MASKKQAMGFFEMVGGSEDLIGDIEPTKEKAPKKRSPQKPKELNKNAIRDQIERSEALIKAIPATPDFLKGLKYREPKKKWFNFRKKEESEHIKSIIANCRRSLNFYIERRTADPRRQINKHLMNYDNQSDLHALHAIYVFNETSNPSKYSGVSEMATQKMDENRFNNLKRSLQEMMFAIVNGSMSLYNVNWFTQIYNEYLNSLGRMIDYRHRELTSLDDRQFKKIIEELYAAKIKITALIIKREELDPFKILTRKLAGSSYAVENFSEKHIKEAGHAVEKDPNKLILHKMNANNIIVVLMTTLLLLAKVPLFNAKKLVEKTLGLIPEVSTNLEMRKRVVMTSIYVTEYKTALALGDVEGQKKAMQAMYDFTLETIKKHIGEQVSTKWHADQILRIAWIALSSENPMLFNPTDYKQVLKEAYLCLGLIIYNCTIEISSKESDSDVQKASPKQKLIDEAIISRCKIVEIGKNYGLNLEDMK